MKIGKVKIIKKDKKGTKAQEPAEAEGGEYEVIFNTFNYIKLQLILLIAIGSIDC